MFTVTMVAGPGRLRSENVESLRRAWSGGDAVWLSPDEAAEFPVMRVPNNLEETWGTLQEQGVDFTVQRTGHRRRRLLIADMDSTMIAQECIDELAEEAGVGAQVARVTEQAMDGAIDFEQALRARVALLDGLEVAAVDRVLASRITHAPGGAELVSTMKAHGARTVLVSGGFTAFAEPIGGALGFHEVQANRLQVVNGRLTGLVLPPVLGRRAKAEALDRAARSLGITPREALAVGDGANDLDMLHLAGLGVAVHAKPSVQAAVRHRVNHGDLTALLFMQGYSRADFSGPSDPEDYGV